MTLLNPAFALAGSFLLPERRIGFQVVHDEFSRLEGVTSMCRCGSHDHDLVPRSERSDPMDNADAPQGPALACLIGNIRKRLLGHSRVVFQGH